MVVSIVITGVGSVSRGDADLLEAFAGWIHPAPRTVTTIYVRNNPDKKNDARIFLFIHSPDFSVYCYTISASREIRPRYDIIILYYI
jgi:hypothetical protein